MQQRKKYVFISLAIIITISLAVAINLSREVQNKANTTEISSQRIYNEVFENPNDSISETEKNFRVEAAKNAIKEFESLPVDTPYSTYDKLYEDIASNYISKLPSVEYEKYFNILDALEQRFLNNPNRQY